MAQDPWENDPIVALPRQRQAATVNGQRYATVRSAYTTETPEELAAQGYALDPATGSYAKTVGQVDVTPQGQGPWANDPIVQAPTQDRSGFGSFGSFAQGAAEQIPFLDEAAAGLLSVTNGIPYSEARSLQSGLAADDRANRPFARDAGGVTGFAAGLAAPGGAFVRGATGVERLARGAAVGAAYGGLYGAGAGEDTYSSRLTGLGVGATVGGLGGAAVEAAAPYATKLAGIASNAAGSVAERIGGTGMQARAAARRAAPTGMGPETNAAVRFADQIGPEQFARRDQARALGVNLSVVDTLDNAGERLVRSAAGPAGPGADAAVDNLIRRQANLKPEVMGVTRNLTGDPRTANAFRQSLEDTRSTLATEQYRPAYETPVAVTEDVLSALGDEPGRAALRRARQAAVARRDANQVAEIDGLLTGDAAEVSAGTLDRIRIALGNRADALGRNATGARDVAGGLRSRAGDIDTALEQVSALAPARATYRDLSGAIDSLDNASAIFNTAPEDFAAQVQSLTPTQREAMTVGVRQEILDALGRQREAGTGGLQTLAEAPYTRQNLEALLGPEEAGRYVDSIRLRVGQTQRAARLSPNTNSQTYGRSIDDETFNVANAIGAVADGAQALRGSPAGLARTIERIGARAALTPQERASIVEMGLGSADDLERIVRVAAQARAAGRRPPREVQAFIVRSRNVLGANNPATQQLETLLLPTRVSAEEEQQ